MHWQYGKCTLTPMGITLIVPHFHLSILHANKVVNSAIKWPGLDRLKRDTFDLIGRRLK